MAASHVASTGTHYMGLMSGTSLDAVDGVVARFNNNGQPTLLAQTSCALPASLRQQLLALNTPGDNELHRAALASNALTQIYAQTVSQLLHQTGLTATQIQAIGAHGQTVRHRPELGYSIQLNAPALLAERSHIAVIADFRARDIAAQGQGAPLVPAFHQQLFQAQAPCVVLNLGGIANISIVHTDGTVSGFDTGPANMLLDAWIQKHQQRPYDKDGAWAAGGTAHEPLVDHLIASEPWLQQAPPKSTGRDLFNLEWLTQRLAHAPNNLSALAPQDIQASLLVFTARTIADAIHHAAPESATVIVCGGGARNGALLQRLASELPGHDVRPSNVYGIDVQAMEALAFAWLAWCWDHNKKAGRPDVTGAQASRLLGCKYPA